MRGGEGVSELVPGLYDELINELSAQHLENLEAQRLRATLEGVDSAELPDRFGEVIGRLAADALAGVASKDRPAAAIELSESLLRAIDEIAGDILQPGRRLADPVRRLTAIEQLTPTDELMTVRRPITPLRDTVLMTNARDEPSVGREIAAEIESADRIDLVMAFIRWTGIRDLLPALGRHVESGKPLRVITTTYTGSTELRALRALADLGAAVKISYDTSSTRLHAKAWLFERPTGFSTVYIGSSNLTYSAQVAGLEWNVRASQRLNPDLVSAFERTFATYWADPHFEPFEPERFREAISGHPRRRQHPDAVCNRAVSVSATDPRASPGRSSPRSSPQPGGCGHRDGQDDHRRARLPDTSHRARPKPTAVRRSSFGDPRTEPDHLSSCASRRFIRGALGQG